MAGNSAPCISAEERERAESERAAQKQRERETDEAARLRAADERRSRTLAAIEESRETRLYIALLLLVLSLAAMGAAGILVLKNLNRAAIGAGAVAAALLIASAVVFLTRPSRDAAVSEEAASQATGTGDRFEGRNSCRLDPERSRVTVSNEPQVELSWNAQGCVNQNTQYAQDGALWRRVLVPNSEQTVTVSEFDPGTGQYVVSRYLLSARAMNEARRLRSRIEQKACTADEEAKLRMADQQRDLLQALPPRPNERLVYQCELTGA